MDEEQQQELAAALKLQRVVRGRAARKDFLQKRDAFRKAKEERIAARGEVGGRHAIKPSAVEKAMAEKSAAEAQARVAASAGESLLLASAGCAVCKKDAPNGKCGRCRGDGHIRYQQDVPCDNCTAGICNFCGGSDHLPENERKECSRCLGSGTCKSCGGSGAMTGAQKRPCMACGGDGLTMSWRGFEEMSGGGHNRVNALQFKISGTKLIGSGIDEFGRFTVSGSLLGPAPAKAGSAKALSVVYSQLYDPSVDMDDIFHYRGTLVEGSRPRCDGRWASGDIAGLATSRFGFHLTGFEDSCVKCNGTGNISLGKQVDCKFCPKRTPGSCRECAGRGFIAGNPDCPKCDAGVCQRCGGDGQKTISISVHCGQCDCTGFCKGCAKKTTKQTP
eukprot:NODE_1704_length_1325_cov_57.870690_g1417_i0.p1 GENE.NODE_1704_length_1325_cov_57.870690_g1417_i0~~NODE_1704_length_1325_cov_57.870690_g1417_i0.p1  ORF type:complete len:422 (+),score=81.94 NODE_1704_length_1325_cov_57.870690_g1417_i0:97-1266(+)